MSKKTALYERIVEKMVLNFIEEVSIYNKKTEQFIKHANIDKSPKNKISKLTNTFRSDSRVNDESRQVEGLAPVYRTAFETLGQEYVCRHYYQR